MNHELTNDEVKAIEAFRSIFPAKRIKVLGYRSWEAALLEAWANDWPEQRGELRSLRNSPRFESCAAILTAYRNWAKQGTL